MTDMQAPIESVFAAITDPKRGAHWNPNVLEVTHLSTYPVREGTTWCQTTVLMGHPTKLNCKVVRLKPPYEGILEVSGPHRATIVTRCRTVEAGTRVTQSIEFQLPGGPLGAMAAKLVTPQMHREMTESLARVKEAVELESVGSNGQGAV
jgi:uncharacterized protein YndB with AHSA1/START domain